MVATIFNKFFLFCLFSASIAFAQAARFDSVAQGPRGPIPNAFITLCAGTATISGGLCSPSTQSVTNQAGNITCASGFPVVLSPVGSSCQATTDALGNFGFWLTPGSYLYSISGPSVTTPQTFTITVPVGATSGGITIIPVSLNNVAQVIGSNCTVAGINAANAIFTTSFPGSGGTVDARGCIGNPLNLGNGTITVGDAATQTPVKLLLGSGSWVFANTAGAHGFKIVTSGSSIHGPGQIALIITCSGAGMGDFVHAEGTGTGINAIEVEGFRIDGGNCPNSIQVNYLSTRDASSIHHMYLFNWLGTALNIGPSANGGALLSQGLNVNNVYMQSGTGALTANSVNLVANETHFGPNVKVIQTGTNASLFPPIVLQPSVTPGGDGTRNNIFDTAVSCNNVANTIGLVLTSPSGTARGAQANVIGPNYAAENCGTAVKFTGFNGTLPAINNTLIDSASTPATSLISICDFCQANKFFPPFSNGNAGDISFTANSSNNILIARLGAAATDVSNAGSGNSIQTDLTVTGQNVHAISDILRVDTKGFHSWEQADAVMTSAGHYGFMDLTQGSGKTGFAFQTTSGAAGFTEGLFTHAITASRTWTMPDLSSGIPVSFSCGNTGSGSQTCAPAAATSKTQMYNGESTLAANTATITFPNGFTSATSYFCVANDVTTRANPVQMVPASATTATITNTTGATDVIQWICLGQ